MAQECVWNAVSGAKQLNRKNNMMKAKSFLFNLLGKSVHIYFSISVHTPLKVVNVTRVKVREVKVQRVKVKKIK
jgi:hypothetical protein